MRRREETMWWVESIMSFGEWGQFDGPYKTRREAREAAKHWKPTKRGKTRVRKS